MREPERLKTLDTLLASLGIPQLEPVQTSALQHDWQDRTRSRDDFDMSARLAELTRTELGDSNTILAADAQRTISREVEGLQSRVLRNPYDAVLRLELSNAYRSLHYPDLAAGEAYKALLLIDEINNESGEYHDGALAALEGYQSFRGAVDPRLREDDGSEQREAQGSNRIPSPHSDAVVRLSAIAHQLLVLGLFDCDCLQSAVQYAVQMLKTHPQTLHWEVSQTVLSQFVDVCGAKDLPLNLESIEEVPDAGSVRRELYPWNSHEADRFSDDSMHTLNAWLSDVAPQLEVKSTLLRVLDSQAKKHGTEKQLGLFARSDLAPGEVVLNETSLLTASGRDHDTTCDACSLTLRAEGGDEQRPVACEACDEAVFCSERCLEMAQELYHPALCERDVSAIAKDVPAGESSDALYTLLLLRTLAMSETQNVHPLDLREVRYIWGDFSTLGTTNTAGAVARDPHGGHPRTLPFSFKYNILLPLNMLEQMDLNIFEDGDRFGLWVFNTLYAKFRGTASARQGPDGRPAVAAVHPLWCLANHSCDPDVTWTWEGSMKLRVKEIRQQWEGTPPDAMKRPGVPAGHEVLNHYCDVTLDVKNRREWALGALGGPCQCPRCQWEANLI